MKVISKSLFLGLSLLFVALTLAGCGKPQTGEESLTVPATEAERLMMKVEDMKEKAFVAEVRESGIEGQFERRWSQDGKGSWRWDRISTFPTPREVDIDLSELPETMIYKADAEKAWLIRGDKAYEITDLDYLEVVGEYGSPISISALGSNPETSGGFFSQTGEDGIWEWHSDPRDPKINRHEGDSFSPEPWQRLEFLGPEGFLSKAITGDQSTVDGPGIIWEKNFEYLYVGDVTADLFELPANVKEVKPFEEWMKEMESSMAPPR